MSRRTEKVQDAIRDMASLFLQREAGPGSLITVTRADVSPDLKHSTIYFTVLPESKEEEALKFVEKRLHALREHARDELRLRVLPFFKFQIDKGERNRQRIDEISRAT